MKDELTNFINHLPKAELHLHIEGSFEPELMFKIADRNKIKLKYPSVEKLKAAYEFNNLQEFLDIYYAGANALQQEEDFYDLAMAYFEKINTQNVLHTEIMFDPQTHTDRNIKFYTVLTGLIEAQKKAKEEYGISSKLILNFLRHLSEKSAFDTLEQAKHYKHLISAIGLDSSELGNPPSKFEQVFKQARDYGFTVIAHAGEEAPAKYIWEAVNLLKVSRIDHGIRSIDDEKLIQELVKEKTPLTVCPLSNVKLKNVETIEKHPIKKMLDFGLNVNVNSDDPAYFGGYMNENYDAITKALNLTKKDLYNLTKNSFNASFLNIDEKSDLLNKLDEYYKLNNS